MVKNTEKVAVVKCRTYNQKEVDRAVENSLKLINFQIKNNSKVLIKPNIVGNFPKKQIICTTHPALIEAVCKILKKHNCKIIIGDSPFTNPELSFRASGIEKIAKKYGRMLIFEQDSLIAIHDKKAKVLKKFRIAKTLKNVDLIINMPKMKTHSLTKYTGAVKNLYGIIPGGMKQRLHMKAVGEKKFSNLLVDICQNIKPELTIMDAVIAMEGDGPTSGDPKKTGLILASKNGIAIDMVACKIMGVNPREIFYLNQAVKRKLYPDFKFKSVGAEIKNLHFRIPTSHMKSKVKRLIRKIFGEKPIICNTKKCIRCSLCAKKCPAKAITLNLYPEIDKKKCIRCFCCIEICPRDAMMVKK